MSRGPGGFGGGAAAASPALRQPTLVGGGPGPGPIPHNSAAAAAAAAVAAAAGGAAAAVPGGGSAPRAPPVPQPPPRGGDIPSGLSSLSGVHMVVLPPAPDPSALAPTKPGDALGGGGISGSSAAAARQQQPSPPAPRLVQNATLVLEEVGGPAPLTHRTFLPLCLAAYDAWGQRLLASERFGGCGRGALKPGRQLAAGRCAGLVWYSLALEPAAARQNAWGYTSRGTPAQRVPGHPYSCT